MLRIEIGDAIVTRIEDYEGPGFAPGEMFTNFEPGQWEPERDWLVPRFYDPAADQVRTSIHSWLVRTPRHTILIDACIGNHKPRPSIPRFHMRDQPWLERLAAAGAKPEEIDFVMCTHLHADHVGWNTRLVDGRWVPTFPNARYLFTRAEYERWDDRQPGFVPKPINQHVFADSILPVAESGQMLLVDDGHQVDEVLTVEAAYGHTAGHVKIRLRSGAAQGMFSGDVIHHPLQLPFPHLISVFDEDPARALQTRLDMLADCAERRVLLMPTHFAAPYCCHVEHDAGRARQPAFRGRWHAYSEG
jgi:glyoxylase-like metal-dependent hydrolase (beta-lactamase superfamily II)